MNLVSQCARTLGEDVEPEFTELRNVRTDDTFEREEVDLVRGSDAYESLRGGKA